MSLPEFSSRKIVTFRLAPRLKDLLIAKGFRAVEDLDLESGPVALSRLIGCSPKDAQNIIDTIRIDLRDGLLDQDELAEQEMAEYNEENSNHPVGSNTSLAQALAPRTHWRIAVPGHSLDTLLGGGVEPKKITEFVGVPGIGKTQLGIQLGIDVQIPQIFGGAQGHCIYADTEGSVMPARVAEIAQATVEYLNSIADTPEKVSALESFTTESVLSGIEYYRVHDHIEQIALVMQLPNLIEEHNTANPHNPVRLVVIDSIAFHFRTSNDMAQRTRLLTSLANQLMALAVKYEVAVVVTNQVTIRGGTGVIPALGETWSHNATVRVLLERAPDSTSRRAKLIKSNSHEPGTAYYDIKPEGVR